MILIDKLYISDFMKKSIVELNLPIIKNSYSNKFNF